MLNQLIKVFLAIIISAYHLINFLDAENLESPLSLQFGETSLRDIIPSKNVHTTLSVTPKISYIWRQNIDFPNQPGTVNIQALYYIWESNQDYIVLQTTDLLWQNRNYITDPHQAVNWISTLNSLVHNDICINSQKIFGFQKVQLEVGYDKEEVMTQIRQRSLNEGELLDYSCGNFQEVVEVQTSSSTNPESLVFSHHFTIPDKWNATINDMKVLFKYNDEFITSDNDNEVQRNILENGVISSKFRSQVVENQAKTRFKYGCLFKFRGLERVTLPFRLRMKWFGYTNYLDKPTEASSDWSVSSVIDIPMKNILEESFKYSRSRSFNTKPMAVTPPMHSMSFKCQ